jgi:hypothetical protein
MSATQDANGTPVVFYNPGGGLWEYNGTTNVPLTDANGNLVVVTVISASQDANGNAVVYATKSGVSGLYEYDNGWLTVDSTRTYSSLSATRNANGDAVVYGGWSGHGLWEYDLLLVGGVVQTSTNDFSLFRAVR